MRTLFIFTTLHFQTLFQFLTLICLFLMHLIILWLHLSLLQTLDIGSLKFSFHELFFLVLYVKFLYHFPINFIRLPSMILIFLLFMPSCSLVLIYDNSYISIDFISSSLIPYLFSLFSIRYLYSLYKS